MKGKFLIIMLGTVVAACSATTANDSYTVTTEVSPDLNGKSAFIVNYDSGEKIDSTTVTNGIAVFSGNIKHAIPARLIVEGSRAGTFILEPGEIKIEGGAASGSELNDLNTRIALQIQQRFVNQFNALPLDSTAEGARQQILNSFEAFADSVVEANSNNPIGYFYSLEKAYSMTLPELQSYLSKHPSLREYQRVSKLIEAAEKKAATGPGNKFTDFTIKNDSTTQSLSDYVGKGKPVLVDFWASWCGPCIRETKVLKELLEEYGPQGLEVLGVAVWDEPENTLSAIKRHNLPWPQIINAQAIPTDIYGISGIPCILLIGPDGTILSRDKQDEELKADIRAYFNGTLTPESLNAATDSVPAQ